MEAAHDELYAQCASASSDDVARMLKAGLENDEETLIDWAVTKEARAFWHTLATLTDKDKSGSIDDEELSFFQSMLSLSAVTSVNDDPSPTAASRLPSPEQLIDEAHALGDYGTGAVVYNTLRDFTNRDERFRIRTTAGAIVFDASSAGAGSPPKQFIRFMPVRRVGERAQLSLVVAVFTAQNSAASWAEFVRDAEAQFGANVTNKFVNIPMSSLEQARATLERVMTLEPLASAAGRPST